MKNDRYFEESEVVLRLQRELQQHGKLLIAFDFDNTVFDFHNSGDKYPKVIELLRRARDKGHTLILFTANPNTTFCVRFCEDAGIKPDYVNCSPLNMGERKPYYNILLDDRAGLGECYRVLNKLI